MFKRTEQTTAIPTPETITDHHDRFGHNRTRGGDFCAMHLGINLHNAFCMSLETYMTNPVQMNKIL